MTVVSRGGAITRTVAFASRLDPHNSIDECRTGISGGAQPETCTLDVTPVSPCTSDILNA